MSIWGLGLFQSKHDFSIIAGLDHDAGIPELQEKAEEEARAEGKTIIDDNSTGDENEILIQYSIFAGQCTDIDAVREHLDSGVLIELLTKKEVAMLSARPEEYPYPDGGYSFAIAVACAMTLGCTIPEQFKESIQKVFTCVGLLRVAVAQMNKALNGPNGYKDGEPYDFDAIRLVETARAESSSDRSLLTSTRFTAMNAPAATGLFNIAPNGWDNGLSDLKAKFESGAHFGERCGSCASKVGKSGGALLRCAKCMKRKYCSKECQTKGFKAHKKLCGTTVEQEKENV